MSPADLPELLKKQTELYRRAIEMERELSAAIDASDFKRVGANTERKKHLMGEIQQTYDQLVPCLKRAQAEDGSMKDGENETLRQEAVSLLKELQELETANLAKVEGSRKRMIEGLKQSQVAKRAARSYGPPRGQSPRHFDTKR